MVFSSISFVFFILPLFLISDGISKLSKSSTLRNLVLFTVSLFFYTWGEARNVFLLIALAVLNYVAGIYIAKSSKQKLTLSFFIVINLGVLFFYKYLFWILSFFHLSNPNIKMTLPLGISFFTFHAISYIIDVYRKDINAEKNLLNFITYFCMFPHLVAGPIVRYRQVHNELRSRADEKPLFAFGMYRFLLGLNKKLIIANFVAPIADTAFAYVTFVQSFGDAWLGALAYAIQIYFDFSAYSDMAIGLAAMAGFRFEENFKRPYSAVSIRDFWKRWHISLSSWFRDYLYIPLGGSRKGKIRTFCNLLIVFLLCGLWHGANSTFVIWGLWHGLFLIIEHTKVGNLISKLPTLVSRLYVTFIVLIGWVFFRSDSLTQAKAYFKVMLNPFHQEAVTLLYFKQSIIAIVIGVLICILPDKLLSAPTSHEPTKYSSFVMLIQAVLFFYSIANLLQGARSPFIYFNF